MSDANHTVDLNITRKITMAPNLGYNKVVVNIIKNRSPETTPGKHTDNLRKSTPCHPQKHGFRVGWDAKITQNEGRQKVPKMSPKSNPKFT